MKTSLQGRQPDGFTLVELLAVLVLVGILTALLLPPITRPRLSQVTRTRIYMAELVQAIRTYEAAYSHWPLANLATNTDVTCGVEVASIHGFKAMEGVQLISANSDLMIILMDLDMGVNAGHKLNPKRIQFLAAKMTGDTNSPGVSAVDYQYRDPWGNPYVISLDANHDDHVSNALYSNAALYPKGCPASLTNHAGAFDFIGNVMVWSLGPDGKASMSAPASDSPNRDNVRSWE